MPGGTKPLLEKVRPKPRTSMASTNATNGGFLERMMRPTQSSAQKTHEKVETKSPPRKVSQPLRPKRTSDGNTSKENSAEKEEAKISEPEQLGEPTPSVSADQTVSASGDTPSTNGASKEQSSVISS